MNHQSLYYSINHAVSDGSQREWTSEEIDFIARNLKLQEELNDWLQNSISDGCWHPENYKILKSMPSSLAASFEQSTLNYISDEVEDIPF
ncbi:hypothetical protein [Nodularia sp. UHCC 0506]|uniref:hypothetical protein n=1 Tax=Nodularia sp. UHCC 0506 TaxID=3110243 RepID=UPI002B211620|nr:hypothetical protein [Nodularia sp. UHCC 0506]MEA5516966.1 hypothetical protein [Nodularia sp. UHCC 0506]